MATSLSPDFWRLFVALLIVTVVATVVISAALDALVVRLRRRGADGPPQRTKGPREPDLGTPGLPSPLSPPGPQGRPSAPSRRG